MSTPTQTNPKTEILCPTTPTEAKAAGRVKSKIAREANKILRESLREQLDVGVWTYPDSPPGVGWVLERTGKPNRYYNDRNMVVWSYWQLVSRGEG